ncbi:MAG: hypothetical protein KAI63_02065 [Planctomycetes bacterium]|nr:hypothetical protein [Planctomycetota bacterium]
MSNSKQSIHKRYRARWIIFSLLAITILASLFIKADFPFPAAQVVQNVYDKIESLPAGSAVVIAFDFSPGAAGELEPMALAMARHCFKKDLRVIGLTIWDAPAVPIMEDVIKQAATEYQKKDGLDYTLLPFKPGLIYLTMCQDFYLAYPKDYRDQPTRELPVFHGIKNLSDVDYVFDIASLSTIETWIAYGKEKADIELGAACTAVMATDYYPFLQSKQLHGLVGGLGAIAQYETLLQKKERAYQAMIPQSAVHLLIILLIVIGNLIYLKQRKKN